MMNKRGGLIDKAFISLIITCLFLLAMIAGGLYYLTKTDGTSESPTINSPTQPGQTQPLPSTSTTNPQTKVSDLFKKFEEEKEQAKERDQKAKEQGFKPGQKIEYPEESKVKGVFNWFLGLFGLGEKKEGIFDTIGGWLLIIPELVSCLAMAWVLSKLGKAMQKKDGYEWMKVFEDSTFPTFIALAVLIVGIPRISWGIIGAGLGAIAWLFVFPFKIFYDVYLLRELLLIFYWMNLVKFWTWIWNFSKEVATHDKTKEVGSMTATGFKAMYEFSKNLFKKKP